eukprot:4212131-Pleurochrysis_carterae.AAC.1
MAPTTEGKESVDKEAGVLLEESWLAGDAADSDSLLRLTALRTMGVVTGNDATQDASSFARFLCALMGGGVDERAVQAALSASAAAGEDEHTEGEAQQQQQQQPERVTAAGRACIAALRAPPDALGAAGAAAVLQGARALRAKLDMPASVAARGTLAAQKLRTLSAR